MADEGEEGGKKLVEEAAGIGASFVRTLGLTDIVFGSVLLYWLRLWVRSTDWPLVLPSTGYSWIDVVLLAAAAALVGKVLSLLVSFGTAALDGVIDDIGRAASKAAKGKGGYTEGLRVALDAYRRALGQPATDKEHDLRDLAEDYVAAASPDWGAALERKRVEVSILHSGAVVTLLYGLYFFRQPSVPRGLCAAVFCAALVLLLTAVLTQLDYVKTLRDRVEILLHRRHPPRTNMEVRIDCEEPHVAARAAAMVLEGLTVLREAMAVRTDSDVAALLKRIEAGEGHRGSGKVERVLHAAGERFMKGELPDLTPDDLLVLDGLLSVAAPEHELELVVLAAGTLNGVWRDLIHWLAERMRAAVQATNGLLPTNATPNLKDLQKLLPETDRPRRIASGLLAFGARRFRTGYTLLRATNVRVLGDDRHSGSGVPFNPVFTGPYGQSNLQQPGANA